MDSLNSQKMKSEHDTLLALCKTRKQQNLQGLKQWDQTRAQYLMTHRRATEQIDELLQARITESDEFLAILVQYFDECVQQQRVYETQAVTNPDIKLHANEIRKNVQRNTSKSLARLYGHASNFKNMRRISKLLEKWVTQINQLRSENDRQIMEIRTQLELTIVELLNSNDDTTLKCNALVSAYRDKNSNLYCQQQEFLMQAFNQTMVQKKLGELTVSYLQCVEQVERNKLAVIKQALSEYLTCLLEIRSDSESVRSLIDILDKKTQEKYLDILYSSEELLSQELLAEVSAGQKSQSTQPLSIQRLKGYLRSLGFKEFDCRNLVLKEYRSYIKLEDESLQNCMLLITIDGFLHIYQFEEYFEPAHTSPNLSLHLGSTANYEISRQGDLGIAVRVMKWQFLGLENGSRSNERLHLVFLSDDQREEFLEFVHRVVGKQ